MSRLTYTDFSRQFFSVLSAIQTSLEQFPQPKDDFVPVDWNEMRAKAQTSAEDLMICPNVERAVEVLRRDRVILKVVTVLATELSDATFLSVLQRAYVNTPHATPDLPGQAFAAFLIELCNGPESLWKTD